MVKHQVRQPFRFRNTPKHYLPPEKKSVPYNPYGIRVLYFQARILASLSCRQLTAQFRTASTVTYMSEENVSPQHELWTLSEVASYWRCSPNSARTRLGIVGSPPAIRLPGSRAKLYDAVSVREWTLRHTEHPGEIVGAATRRLRGPRTAA